MNDISVSRVLTPRPVALAVPAAAQPPSVATAPVRDARPAAPAPEPTRAQSAEQRLRKNRPEEEPPQVGTGVSDIKLKFGDFLDLINPLQHIPIISTIYRAITGDEISGPAKILGGLLFGGPIGFIAAIFDTIVAQATGRDLGETVLAAFSDEDAAPAVQVAAARDIQGMSAPDDAPEAGSSTANRNPGPALDRGDPFGLERSLPAPIAPAPGPQAVTAPGIGAFGEKALVFAARRPDPSNVPAAAGAPVVAVERVSADAPVPGNPRLVPNFAATDRGFAERMLEALDKYRALASERARDDNPAPRRLDLTL